MKMNYSKLAIIALTTSMQFMACTPEENQTSNDTFSITTEGNTKTLVGTVNRDITMDAASNWVLSGGIFVADGATLTIEEGTTIKSDNDPQSGTAFLSVAQGAKIMAVGTATNPIVFTSGEANPNAGDWGGIIINGYGKLNTGSTAEGEGGTGIYGGNDNTDNSGVLKYVRVEYAGKILGTDNELNGFSFNGVGSGTTIEYIQAYRGADDGIEFFGGAAQVRYAVSTGNEDDSFDWTQGWIGKGQFWVVKQMATGGDRGFEGDNNGDDNAVAPYSNPTISNVTMLGMDDGDASNQGMKLREGTKCNIYNAIVTGFPKRGIQIEHDVTIANMDNKELSVSYSIIDNVNPFKFTNSAKNDTTTTNMINQASYMNQTATDGSLVSFMNGYVGTTHNGIDVNTIDNWFHTTNFIGAVESSNDWTAGWTK